MEGGGGGGGGGSSKPKCTSTTHRQLIDNAKSRLVDIQQRFAGFLTARNEGRNDDAALLEGQVYQSLCDWKAELDTPSPANSLLAGSLGSFTDEIARFLQLSDEQDDATSKFVETPLEFKPELNGQSPNPAANFNAFMMENVANDEGDQKFPGFDLCDNAAFDLPDSWISNSDLAADLDSHQLSLHDEIDQFLIDGNSVDEINQNAANPNIFPAVQLPLSAFMGPKCALWDCTRPAQGGEWYCNSFHADVAYKEDPPGAKPVLRPGGISIKDSLLYSALKAKSQSKHVGIPECSGAATTKSPWNAPELFDISFCDGETIREWLFFDKPRRAFESGNRKQRSLPDYNGRGWHESRKQVMKEFDGQKRSYYMDPQPSNSHEWHLFEYEIYSCVACALYRLELKLGSAKKTPKAKVLKDPLADLQKKMGRLTAEFPGESETTSVSPPTSGKSKAKGGRKNTLGNDECSQNEGSHNKIPTGLNNRPSGDKSGM
ncbi:hypothetical protein ACFE04_018403 [Oxalis oulophora]